MRSFLFTVAWLDTPNRDARMEQRHSGTRNPDLRAGMHEYMISAQPANTITSSMESRDVQHVSRSQLALRCDRSLLLILEADLSSRFAYAERVLCRDKYVLPLANIIHRNPLHSLVARLGLRHDVSRAYEELKEQLGKYQFVFLSNTEGFIARNIGRWIKRDFPGIVLLSLQHGIFLLENNRRKQMIVRWLNKLTEFALDYSAAGTGAIQDAVDFYIVYNNWYKSLLVRHGVPSDRVIVSALLLKGEKLFENSGVASPGNRTALFLLQCLSALGITNQRSEARLIDGVVKWLSRNYDTVLLKQHPYRAIAVTGLPANCRFVEGDVMDIAKNCGTAVSFFSTALLECEFLGLRTIAIRDDEMKVAHVVYDLFSEVGEVQKDGSLLLRVNTRPFSAYYESEIRTTEEFSAFVEGWKGSSRHIPDVRPALRSGAGK